MIRLLSALLISLALLQPSLGEAASKVALSGYDPVTLAEGGKPARGVSTYSTEWNGATWQFASADNRAKFISSPEKYAPAYNGYCPVSLAEGKPMPGDITQVGMHEGKMYVMSSPEAKQTFMRDPFKVIDMADPTWNKLREGLSQ